LIAPRESPQGCQHIISQLRSIVRPSAFYGGFGKLPASGWVFQQAFDCVDKRVKAIGGDDFRCSERLQNGL